LRGPKLERAEGEIPWSRIQVIGRRPVAIPEQTMAETAAPEINGLALLYQFRGRFGFRVAGFISRYRKPAGGECSYANGCRNYQL